MKNYILSLLLATLSLTFYSCERNDSHAEEVAEEIGDAIDEISDAVEEAAEKSN